MTAMMVGMWALMVIGFVLVLAIIGSAVYLAVRVFGARNATEGPREVLDRRLAAGEITPEEHHEREAMLRGTVPPGRGAS